MSHKRWPHLSLSLTTTVGIFWYHYSPLTIMGSTMLHSFWLDSPALPPLCPHCLQCELVAGLSSLHPCQQGVVVPFPLNTSLSLSLSHSLSLSLTPHILQIHSTLLPTCSPFLPSFPKSELYPMASLLSPTILLLFLVFIQLSFFLSSSSPVSQLQKSELLSRRKFIAKEDTEEPASKPLLSKKKGILEAKNQTKLKKPKKIISTATIPSAAITKSKLNKTLTSTLKKSNSTKLIKQSNSTKLIKQSNSTKLIKPAKLTKSNSTKSVLKSLKISFNSTKSSKKILDPPLPKNKTTASKPATASEKNPKAKPKPKPATAKSEPWLPGDDSDDLISEFRDLPSRLQESLLPDLERLSTTSKAYLSRANREIAEGVKPYVGKSFAPKIASIASVLFLVLPLLLVAALFRRLRSYLSLHRLLVFVQAYLAIYFATLAVTALATGLEPLKFFYATSPSSYAWTQAVQTFGYLVYLVVQLIDLVVLFSAGDGVGAGARALGLAQMVVGLAVGMHYYAAVFHRAVTGEPPRANWRVHGVYSACFLLICACARAERRKKAYLSAGGEDGKKN